MACIILLLPPFFILSAILDVARIFPSSYLFSHLHLVLLLFLPSLNSSFSLSFFLSLSLSLSLPPALSLFTPHTHLFPLPRPFSPRLFSIAPHSLPSPPYAWSASCCLQTTRADRGHLFRRLPSLPHIFTPPPPPLILANPLSLSLSDGLLPFFAEAPTSLETLSRASFVHACKRTRPLPGSLSSPACPLHTSSHPLHAVTVDRSCFSLPFQPPNLLRKQSCRCVGALCRSFSC